MILVAGDSFTEYTDKPMWHDVLINPRHKKMNLAKGGAGNIYIGEAIKKMLGNKIRACLIMWSEMDRLDISGSVPKTKYYSPLGGKFWNHHGGMVSGTGKSHWKRLGYDKVVEMNIDSILSTHDKLDQLGIPYAYSFINDSDLIPERLKADAIQPFLGDYAVEKQLLEDDNYHANVEAHKQWSDLVLPQIKFKELIS